MNRSPYQRISLFTIAMIVLAGLPGRSVSHADALAARQLPTEIVAAQTTPDITITDGFSLVAGVGDFNGDGVSDFLITYRRQPVVGGQTDPFKFGIIFGKRNPAQPITIDLTKDAPDLTLTTRATDMFGLSNINTFGDLNNDGIDDFVVQQFFDNEAVTHFKIFYGSPKWRPGTEDADTLPGDLTIVSASAGPRVVFITGAADVNGDGVRDLLMTEIDHTPQLTAALLLGPFTPGATVDLNERPADVLIEAGGAYPLNGLFMADVNGDHVADVIIKRGHFDSRLMTSVTTVDVAFGSPDWQPGTKISWATQPPDASINAGVGTAIVQVGDVNGDGTADILAGFPWYGGEPAPPAWFPGSVSIFLGSPSLRGTVNAADTVIAGLPSPQNLRPIFMTTLGDHLGEAMAIGDVNGDGKADILIGAPGETSNDTGILISMSHAYVIIGSPELKNRTRIETFGAQQDITISFSPKADDFGTRVETSDFNGDGIRDLLVSNNHKAYVYFGGPLRAPEVTAAKYKSKTGELTVLGTGFNGSARVEINGVLIDVPSFFDAEQGALVLHGTPAELNLRDGKNQIVLTRQGARSNAVKIKMKG